MATTESFGRGRIAETILASTSVPFTLKVSKVPTNENQFITIDPDTNNEEILYYTTKTGTIGAAGTLNITGRGYNVQNDTQAVGNQEEHEENGEFKLALNHIIINDKMDLVLDNVVLSEIGFGNVLKTGLTVNNLTTVQRNALTPANGAIIYNTTDNVNQQYIGGAWANIGDTGTADASETVAGKVEMATQAQYDARTTTGETGALLVPQMGQLPIYATATTEGLVELTTDAEALAGTDETRYVNSKQVKDNYGFVIVAGDTPYYTSTGTIDIDTTTWTEYDSVTVNKAGTYRLTVDRRMSNTIGDVATRLLKNTVVINTSTYTTSESIQTQTFDVTIADGDVISVEGNQADTDSFGILSNFNIKGELKPNIFSVT